MASFTDNPNIQFNPYIQQLPVEAMVKVGMEKQQRYDEGVQKIQSQIDNIAGLDIIRDIDKQYLQTKLNELQTNLRTFAAGDFSNFQLVNSLSGMTKQLEKDKNIQSAVSSTAWYRKQAAEMEKAISEGKSSQSNVWDFNDKASKWLSSNDINYQFKDRYTPYTDVNKKMFEALKALHPNLKETDIPYEKNPDGSLNYGKIAAAMQRISNEAITSGQIENAIRAVLTPDDINQLSIDGRYRFREYDTPEKLSVYSTTKFKNQIEDIDKKLTVLNGMLNIASSSPKELDAAKRAIEELSLQKASLNNQLQEELEYIRTSPEEAKAYIYKNGTISQFANAFSWEKNSVQMLTNPVLQAQFEQRRLANDDARLAMAIESHSWEKSKKLLDEEESKLKIEKLRRELYGGPGEEEFTVYGGASTKIKDPVMALRSDAADKQTAANSAIEEISKLTGLPAAGVEERLLKFQNGDITAIPVQLRGIANDLVESRKEAKRLNLILQTAEKEAESNPTIRKGRTELKEDLKKLPTLNISGTTFSQEEVLNMMLKLPKGFVTGSTGGAAFSEGTIDYKNLTNKEKLLYNTFISKDPQQSKIRETFNKYNDVESKYRNVQSTYESLLSENLMTKTGSYLPMMSSVKIKENENDSGISRTVMEGNAMNVLMRYGSTLGGTKGGAETLSKKEIETAREWLSSKDKSSIQYKNLEQGDNKYLVMVKGNEEIVIPLTQSEYSIIPKSKSTLSFEARRIKKFQKANAGNTNITRKDPQEAWFSQKDFPNVKNLSVTADLQADNSNDNLNYININVKLPSRWKNLQLDDFPMDADQAILRINGLTDGYIKDLFLKSDKVPESWKEEIRNLK